MKKNVWILNHYATNTYFDRGGRHYWFARELKQLGYEPLIVCASTVHSNTMTVDLQGKLSIKKYRDEIPYLFIKTGDYIGNGLQRLNNIFDFSLNGYRILNNIEDVEKPDVIIASSVHPLTCVLGIKLASQLKVPCIVEIRDLWPEELIDMKVLKKNSIVSTILYKMEHWIYKRAHAIVFTMEGGKQYVIDRGWAGKNNVSLAKIHYINNGISLFDYRQNLIKNAFDDVDLDNNSFFKIVYTGSIRQANGVDRIIEIANRINEPNIKFLLWGAGDYVETLKSQVRDRKLDNIIYKGFIEKKYIPYILSKSDLNILNYQNADIFKYGCSNNKLFEYLASGKPIVSTIKMNYSILKQFNCGVEVNTVDESVEQILRIYKMTNYEKRKLIENTVIAANEFDFKNLTKKLVDVIEEV